MPLVWDRIEAPASAGASPEPEAVARLWAHRSLPRGGFVVFIAVTAGLFLLPLLALLGTPALWGLLPFILGVLGLTWFCLGRSYRGPCEVLHLRRDRIELVHHDASGRRRTWAAHPHWVSVHLHREGGPVGNYLTLRGGQREVELGAFLSEGERVGLYRDLLVRIGGLRGFA